MACNQGDKMTGERQLIGQGQGGLTPLPEDGQGVVIGIETSCCKQNICQRSHCHLTLKVDILWLNKKRISLDFSFHF